MVVGIDAPAAQKVRFTKCHSQPLCNPSRIQRMAGRYHSRNEGRFGLQQATLTRAQRALPDALRSVVLRHQRPLEGARAANTPSTIAP
jgi:arylsulfatase A-like enzyme